MNTQQATDRAEILADAQAQLAYEAHASKAANRQQLSLG